MKPSQSSGYQYDFKAAGYPFRLYSGTNALDRLPEEVARHRAQRAFIVCGRTVSRTTSLISRMRELLGARLAGVFDEIDKDTSRSSVARATHAARAAQADLMIGVGAGSVIQGTRIVTILLAEKRPIEELVTQYPDHGPAISPKLLELKLPIINVLTAPTTAVISIYPHVGEGEAYSALIGTVLRRLGNRDPEAMARIAAALGVGGVARAEVPDSIADKLEAEFRLLGMPARLSNLGIERDRLQQVLEHSLRNFNADPKRDFVRERDLLDGVLQQAW